MSPSSPLGEKIMKKIKNVIIVSMLLVGIIIGVIYANIQVGVHSTDLNNEPKISIRNGTIPYDGIFISEDFLRNWSITMPNHSININKYNDTHDSFSMVYDNIELFSFVVDRNTSKDIINMLQSLVFKIVDSYSNRQQNNFSIR